MKKIFTMIACAIFMQSCYSPTGTGAATGALAGGSLGGAIGGMIGGWRGHHLGTVVGVIAGAATGAAVASSAESRIEQTRAEADRRYHDYVRDYHSTTHRSRNTTSRNNEEQWTNNDEYYSPTDKSITSDRSYNLGRDKNVLSSSFPLVLRNLRFIDGSKNHTINRQEDCKIMFELANSTNQSIYDVVPYVYEINGNPHVTLSPSTRIEVVKPGDVVRYTCSLRSDNKLKAGELTFRISVAYADNDFVTLKEFSLPSAK